jgi:hypothetical protein
MTFGGLFLRDPALFPARGAGEPWGDGSATADFAGGPYRIHGLDAERRATVLERFSGFSGAGDAEAAVRCRVLRVSPEEFSAFDLRGWEFSLDLDPRPDVVRIAGLDFMARLEWRPTLQADLWTASQGEAFGGVIENLLRVVAAYRLLETGGVLLHSAGVVDAGSAWVFVGRSGAGKTTLASSSRAAGREILSDDLNAIVPAQGGSRVAPVPFAGDYRGSATEPMPLAALCRLLQGPRTLLEPMSGAEALSTLLSAAPFVNQDPHRLERLLDVLETLLASVPALRATVALDDRPWDSFVKDAAVA